MGRLRILLTEGSSLSARHTLNAIGALHHIEVLDAGTWKIGRFSRYVRQWHRVPSYQRAPLEYLARLEALLKSRRFDVLLPTHEETFLISRFQDRLAPLVGLAVPRFESLEQMQSKARFSELLAELNLPQPKTTLVRSREAIEQITEFPVFVKRSISTASQGVIAIRNEHELATAIQHMEIDGWFHHDEELLIQEGVRGIESAAIGLFDHGRMIGFHGMEEWAKGKMGMPMARRSIVHEGVVEHTRRLGEHLQWHGPFCLAYFFDPTTKDVRYIECNPRIGETFNGVLCGVNLCEAWSRLSHGEELEPLPLPVEGVHSYCGFLVALAQTQDGAGRGAVLKTLMDQWRGTGYCRGENELIRVCEDWLSVLPAIAVMGLLLAYPRGGRLLVRGTVSRYALSEQAARGIRELNLDSPR